jgi:hypothetical protein
MTDDELLQPILNGAARRSDRTEFQETGVVMDILAMFLIVLVMVWWMMVAIDILFIRHERGE